MHPEFRSRAWQFSFPNHIWTSVLLKITVIKSYVSDHKLFTARILKEDMVFLALSLKDPPHSRPLPHCGLWPQPIGSGPLPAWFRYPSLHTHHMFITALTTKYWCFMTSLSSIKMLFFLGHTLNSFLSLYSQNQANKQA